MAVRYALSKGSAIGCCSRTGAGDGGRRRAASDYRAGEKKKGHEDVITAPANDGMIPYGKRNHLARLLCGREGQVKLDRSVTR